MIKNIAVTESSKASVNVAGVVTQDLSDLIARSGSNIIVGGILSIAPSGVTIAGDEQVDGDLSVNGGATIAGAINKITVPAPATGATLSLGDLSSLNVTAGKTINFNNSLTIQGNDGDVIKLNSQGDRSILINSSLLANREKGTSGTIAAAGTAYIGEVWKCNNTTNQSVSWSIINGPFEGTSAIRFTFAVAPTSGRIELVQYEPLVTTFGGKTVAHSFYYRSPATMVAEVCSSQVFGTGGSATTNPGSFSNSVGAAASWTRFSQTYALPSTSGATIGTGASYLSITHRFYPLATGNYDVACPQYQLDAATDFWFRPLKHDDYRIKEFWETTYPEGSLPGSTNSNGLGEYFYIDSLSSGTHSLGRALRYIRKVNTPIITMYSDATGASGKVRDNINSADVVPTVSNIGTTSVKLFMTSTAASGAVAFTYHAVIDGRF